MYWLVVASALMRLAPWWVGAVYAVGFLAPLTIAWTAALALPGDSANVRVWEIVIARIHSARLLAFALLCTSVIGYVVSVASV